MATQIYRLRLVGGARGCRLLRAPRDGRVMAVILKHAVVASGSKGGDEQHRKRSLHMLRHVGGGYGLMKGVCRSTHPRQPMQHQGP